MNFNWALVQMKEGKKVKRAKHCIWYGAIENEIVVFRFCSDDKLFMQQSIGVNDINSEKWQIHDDDNSIIENIREVTNKYDLSASKRIERIKEIISYSS